jgi:hypothetical protein
MPNPLHFLYFFHIIIEVQNTENLLTKDLLLVFLRIILIF